MYHSSCYANFFFKDSKTQKSSGRPINVEQHRAFVDMCSWLENENELYTLQELSDKISEYSGPAEPEVYGVKRIKQKLKDKYGDVVFFAEISGRKNVVCFQSKASLIISDKWYSERRANVQDEAIHIIDTAAKLIKDNLRITLQKNYSTETYPTAVKAAMPRSVLPPMLFWLAVELDHIFGSRWLLTQLNKLGFTESYSEVNRFKQRVVVSDDNWEHARIIGREKGWTQRKMTGTLNTCNQIDHWQPTIYL